jgi:2-dehydro-3-deoxyphosphogluconate aldolase / (4S)-4-hydroxy-2-oxoglutarate aldolase
VNYVKTGLPPDTGVERPDLPEAITRRGVIAIGRRLPMAALPRVADALVQGGIGAFELTLNEPAAPMLEALTGLTRTFDPEDLLVGAGTILSIDAAGRALDAGAAFLVSPHTDPELIGWAAERGVVVIPGAFTPTEILAAWRAGASAVKVFPAGSLGPTFVREVRGPLPDIPLVPTGGLSADNAAPFIAAGAAAVGIGSWLMGDGDRDGILDRATRVVSAIAEARAAPANANAHAAPPDANASASAR